jgi:hypothetical protein
LCLAGGAPDGGALCEGGGAREGGGAGSVDEAIRIGA